MNVCKYSMNVCKYSMNVCTHRKLSVMSEIVSKYEKIVCKYLILQELALSGICKTATDSCKKNTTARGV